jgi:hypothetical protein
MPDTPIQGRVLILATRTAGAEPYLAAARKLRLSYVLATEQSGDEQKHAAIRAQTTGPDDGDEKVSEITPALQLRFAQRESALEIVQYAMEHPLAAIVATDDRTSPACARVASMLGLRWHPPRAADLCLDLLALQHRLSAAGFTTPLLGESPSGQDFAVAAILDGGKMRVLGNLKCTPGRPQESPPESVEAPKAVHGTVLRAARETGLSHGPVSARVCLADEKIWILQLGAAISAECVDHLHFHIPLVDEDVSLAEVVVRHTVGMDISRIYAKRRAHR